MIRLLITDLDDTLYSWLGFFIPAFFGMAEKVSEITGINMNRLLEEYRRLHQEKGTVEYPFATIHLPSVKRYYQDRNDTEIKESLGAAFETFNEIRSERLQLFPGVEDTLKAIDNKGIKIIGFTDSGELNGVYRLKMLGICDLFQKIYVSNYEYRLPDHVVRDCRIREAKNGKPDPELLEQIIADEGVDKSEAVYMGDSLTKDIYMAHRAGVKSIQCRYTVSFDAADYYQKLVRISSWTEDVFKKESSLKKACEEELIRPDYLVTEYAEIKNILL